MQCRNETPLGFALDFAVSGNLNFAVDSVFTNVPSNDSNIMPNDFLLLDGGLFNLLDGTQFLLLGT